jgi:hypothetical protein
MCICIRTSNQGVTSFYLYGRCLSKKKRIARTLVVSRTRWRASQAIFHAPRAHRPPYVAADPRWSHRPESHLLVYRASALCRSPLTSMACQFACRPLAVSAQSTSPSPQAILQLTDARVAHPLSPPNPIHQPPELS